MTKLIQNNLNGGKQNIYLFPKVENTIQYTNTIYNKKMSEIIIDKIDYKLSEKIYNIIKQFDEIYGKFCGYGLMNTLINMKTNIEIQKLINQSKLLFEEFMEIYDKYLISPDNLNNFLDKLSFKKYENDSNLNLRYLDSEFKKRIKFYFEEYSVEYTKFFGKYIPNPENTLRSLFVAYLLDKKIFSYFYRDEEMNFYKKVFPEYFEKYPIVTMIRILNWHKALSENKRLFIKYNNLDEYDVEEDDAHKYFEQYGIFDDYDDLEKGDLFY